MIVLVDTSVWSLALRRSSRSGLSPAETKHVRVLEDLIADARVALLGMVRQELLSGIRDSKQFARLRDYLQGFPDVPLASTDYQRAAEMWNACRAHGIAGNPIDLLICSVAANRDWPVYTLDRDFKRYARHVAVKLIP